jgi:HPt (histidine-containing phosphotransfer) domain-containing protein
MGNSTDKLTEMALTSHLESDPDLCVVVDIFVEEFPKMLAEIKNACEDTDESSLKKVAHQLKGASRSAGFMIIGDRAEAIEKQIASDQIDGAKKIVDQLCDLCEKLNEKHNIQNT